MDTEQVVEAILEGVLMRQETPALQGLLPGFEEHIRPKRDELFHAWENAAEKERRSRTVYAQETIRVDEVARELEEMRRAIGAGVVVSDFVGDALRTHGATIDGKEAISVDLTGAPAALREVMGRHTRFAARFTLPVQRNELYLSRTHPIVEGLASFVLDAALDPLSDAVARRCGAIRTAQVERRTTLLLLRYRFHIITTEGSRESTQLAEECGLVAFAGAPTAAEWLPDEAAESLLAMMPDANIAPDQARVFVGRVIDAYDMLLPHLEGQARQRGTSLLQSHVRVRDAARRRHVRYRVEAHLPPDLLGVYVYLPASV